MKRIYKWWHVLFLLFFLLFFSCLCWAKSFRAILTTGINNKNNIESIYDNNIIKKGDFSKISQRYTYLTTGEVESSEVISGDDGWLFYASKEAGDTIADYEGTNLLSDNEIDDICKVILNYQYLCEQEGIKFGIMIPPNKENIYSEYMPDVYKKADVTKTDILVDYLKENGCNVTYPKNSLQMNKSKYQLYYPHDTHWNWLGGYLAAQVMLEDFAWNNQTLPNLDQLNVLEKPLTFHYCAYDDLAHMSGIVEYIQDNEYMIEGMCDIDWSTFEAEQESGEVSHIENDNAIYCGKILIIGDSFRVALLPSIVMIYKDVYVMKNDYYSEDVIENVRPDYLLFETVERGVDTVVYNLQQPPCFSK